MSTMYSMYCATDLSSSRRPEKLMRKYDTRSLVFVAALVSLIANGCSQDVSEKETLQVANPFMTGVNELIDYAAVTPAHVAEYADTVLADVEDRVAAIKAVENATFDNVVRALDRITRDMGKAMNNSWTMYWVSPDAATREQGFTSYQKLNARSVDLFSDREIYELVVAARDNSDLTGVDAKLVDDIVLGMEISGVGLAPDALEEYKALVQELNDLSSQYSNNMNNDILTLTIDEEGAAGLPQGFKDANANGSGGYDIAAIPANRQPVMNNAASEETRRAYAELYASRAADKNLDILDQLVAGRHRLAQIMGHPTYASYNLVPKMAKTPDNVWAFLEDLVDKTGEKARADLERMKAFREKLNGESTNDPIRPWNFGYLTNEMLKQEYGVDHEKIREYLPLDAAMTGMMKIYEDLLGLEFRKVENPSVWHEEVELYEAYEDGELMGRFYLDLFPREGKESWFYGVSLTPGGEYDGTYEVGVSMLLGNFTRPTETLPSLISHSELRTLFHEFGHIAEGISYDGKYAYHRGSLSDFAEAMSQIFENWIWDYDVLKTFAHHYETGEVLPKETFDAMIAARNLNSGVNAQGSLRSAMYDMTLYDRYDPENPVHTDSIWKVLAEDFEYSGFIEGTHPQAAWIHINTHPVYYYGYIWSRVYSQDMFTKFEENGLWDTETGVRYRKIVLANGQQREVMDTVEDFLGRPSNSDAYVRSLGLTE